MRHIVYLLLVANLAYLGWNLFQGREIVEAEVSLPPLPEGVRRLVTLQEHTGDQTSSVDVSELDALTAAQPPGAMSAQGCKALGPFQTPAAAEVVAGRLGDLGLEPVHRSVDGQVENGFWVYLPEMERERSREIARQLKANNDKEYYVGKNWFISLGTFKDIGRAEVRLAEVRKMGLDARLEQRYKTREQYWLELPGSEAASEVLDEIIADSPELQLHTLSCL